MLRCESGVTLKRVLRCSGLKARSLCDGGSITQRLRPSQSEVELQFCDDPQIAHALRCQNAAGGCRIPLMNVVGSYAQKAPQCRMTRPRGGLLACAYLIQAQPSILHAKRAAEVATMSTLCNSPGGECK